MPNLDFFACPEDLPPVLEFIFGRADLRVFESYSRPAEPLREFGCASEVLEAFGCSVGGLGLRLYASSMRGEYEIERFALRPNAFPGSPAWREQIKGWGLIDLQLEVPRERKLRACHTNHNTLKRAQGWASACRDRASPDTWDFVEVTRLSSKVNRYIRSHLGVAAHGSRPVLRHAWEASNAGQLALLGVWP